MHAIAVFALPVNIFFKWLNFYQLGMVRLCTIVTNIFDRSGHSSGNP